MDSFLSNTIKLAKYYKNLGEKTIDQLNDDELTWTPGPDSNSISIIVKHLWGNMLSRWTNFLMEDGEKPWRQRDIEFEGELESREELMSKWNEGWNCFLGALKELNEEDLGKIIYIRNEGHTVEDAIMRQMAHYPYHIGQIVYIGKLLRGADWKSLSIPKGASQDYNSEKFSNEKTQTHFTDNV